MELSIVIVSYNVLPFIRQCLHSVEASCGHLLHEIIVIDNNSSDGSQAYLRKIQKSNFRFLENASNLGYGRAMNQGLSVAKGSHTLLLNPDTIITKDSIDLCLEQLKSDDQCGAVGVRMIDGQGRFLKESKRGYPTLEASIYKMIGLSRLFPKSERFAHYHQGHLDEHQNHKVDILTGAFLMTRKSILDQVGGFDERFFMYGEDIDLCDQIVKQGYYNFYIGETSIIHFKGESTRRDGFKYNYHFYNSMRLFAEKHGKGQFVYIYFLSVILSLLGFLKWTSSNIFPLLRPLIRISVYCAAFFAVSKLWANLYFGNAAYFDYSKHIYLISGYALIMFVGFLIGHNSGSRIKGLLSATVAILVIYSLFPLSLRSSRVVIILGALLILGLEVVSQMIKSYLNSGTLEFWNGHRRAILLGNFDQCQPALKKLSKRTTYQYLGVVGEQIVDHESSLTDIDHLDSFLDNHKIDTLTMHMDTMAMDQILSIIARYGSSYQYLLYSESANAIIESPDSRSQGSVSIVEIKWAIDSDSNRIAKRSVDVLVSCIFILLLPLLIWFVKNKKGWLNNIMQAFLGNTTWVGYGFDDKKELLKLPQIKPAVLAVNTLGQQSYEDNVAYARDYSIIKDISVIINKFNSLGNKVKVNAES